MSATKSPVKVGLIGCGSIANTHGDAYAASPHAEIAAVCDILPDKAEDLRARLGVPRAYTDYHEMLKDSELEAVSVCLPNYLHAPATIAALKAGKHVLCEKPAAMNLGEAVAMRDAARAADKILAIGVVNRFNTHVNLLRDFIAGGKLGTVYHVLIMFKAYRSIPGLGGWFTNRALSGGGVMIDWGVHYLDLVLYCLNFPKPTLLSGVAHRRLGANMHEYAYTNMWASHASDFEGVCDVEEYAAGMLRTDGPTLAFEGAWAQNIGERQTYIEFMGDRGGARLNYGGDFTWWHDEGGVLYKSEPSVPTVSMFQAEIDEFCGAVRGGSIRAGMDTVLRTQAILDAFYRSAEEGREIPVADIG